jgi:hypothetical protein
LILNRTVGTVEGGKDGIAGCIHQATSEEPELLTQDLFVPIEQRPPHCITEFRGTFRHILSFQPSYYGIHNDDGSFGLSWWPARRGSNPRQPA